MPLGIESPIRYSPEENPSFEEVLRTEDYHDEKGFRILEEDDHFWEEVYNVGDSIPHDLEEDLSHNNKTEYLRYAEQIADKLPSSLRTKIFVAVMRLYMYAPEDNYMLWNYGVYMSDRDDGDDEASIINQKGLELLKECADDAALIQSDPSPENYQRIISRLSKLDVDTFILTTTARTLYKNKKALGDKVDLQEFYGEGLGYESVDASDLKKRTELVSEMRSVIISNYESEGYPPEFIAKVLKSFEDAVESPHSRFMILEDFKKLVGFCRFDYMQGDDGDALVYFGSFNFNPSYKKAYLGEAFMNSVLKYEIDQGDKIIADCDPAAPITKKYIEAGFVADQVRELSGVSSFVITANDHRYDNLSSKRMSVEEIVDFTEDHKKTDVDIVVQKYNKDQSPSFELLQQGFVLSRFVSKGDITYCVFEATSTNNYKDKKEKTIAI